MPYLRKCGSIVSTMQLHGFNDAVHAAKILEEKDPDHIYRISPRFLGYEGPDMGVKKHEDYFDNPGKFVGWVDFYEMRILCKDMPLITQEEALQEFKDAKGSPEYIKYVYFR